MAELSIITALHNCVDLTRKYVESLYETLANSEIDWELILIDDASTDETPVLLEALNEKPNIRILHNEENQGYAYNNNRGAQEAKGAVLAFLNNDLILQDDWLQPMLIQVRKPESGAVGNIQWNPETGLIDHAGVFFGLDGMPRQARKNRKAVPQNDVTEWNAVTAACMLMRKEVFKKCGGFDESYRNGFEDIDLCVRLKLEGYKHFVCNRSQIRHCVSPSPGRHDHNNANSDLFEEKWAETCKPWGKKEWPREYLARYARHWWKFNLGKFLKALWMVNQTRQ